jgi:hypothetical protein
MRSTINLLSKQEPHISVTDQENLRSGLVVVVVVEGEKEMGGERELFCGNGAKWLGDDIIDESSVEVVHLFWCERGR